MKTYQITRKLQVTIPKRLADKIGIKPGDSVTFEETGQGVMLRKVQGVSEKPDKIRRAIEEFAKDSYKIRKNVRKAGESVIEDISASN